MIDPYLLRQCSLDLLELPPLSINYTNHLLFNISSSSSSLHSKRSFDPSLQISSMDNALLDKNAKEIKSSHVEMRESASKVPFTEDTFFTCALTEMINYASKKYRLQNTSCHFSLLLQSQMDQNLSIKAETSYSFLSSQDPTDGIFKNRNVNWQYQAEILSYEEKQKHNLLKKRS